MIVASPRPRTVVNDLASILADHISTAHDGHHHTGNTALSHTSAFSQNGVNTSTSPSTMCGDNDIPPPKYTRYSSCSALHLPHPSTSSTSTASSTMHPSTARPSFDSIIPHQLNEKNNTFQAPPAVREVQDDAPPYESSFRDTNLTVLPVEALTALSLARESLSDLQRASFFADLDDLDRSDDRGDPDDIIQRRLTRNALLARQSAISLASESSGSSYSQPEVPPSSGIEMRTPSIVLPQRDSAYSTYDFDPLRVSVQTYGSSVLTYGSRASQLIDGDSNGGGDGSRPVAPLPWLPRPSALDRIQHCGMHPASLGGRARSGSVGSNSGGRRPLPPLPTPTFANPTGLSPTLPRDRSVSLPSRSNSSASNYSGLGSAGISRRPRPLPRTPISTISTNPNLPDILEGDVSESADEGVPPSSGPVRSSSMYLSPTSAAAAAPLNFRSRRSGGTRYSTIAYGHASRVGMRGMLVRADNDENTESTPGLQKLYNRAASRASTRSARSSYFVPDVEELVRILDSMDDGSGPGSGSSSESALTTPLAGPGPGPWTPRFSNPFAKNSTNTDADDEEEIDMGEALSCSRGVVNVPSGEKRCPSAALEDLGIGVAKSIGLPTPAATPRNSPHRQPKKLPGSSKNVNKPVPPLPPPSPKSQSTTVNQEPSPVSQSQSQSPTALTPSDADGLSLRSFPLPPMTPLFIPAPSAVGADEIPIPSANSGAPPSPSMLDFGKSPAEKATLPGMSGVAVTIEEPPPTPPKNMHISAREAIMDLKHRVSELPKFTFPAKKGIVKMFPGGVPLLGFPAPPRRRAQSVAATNALATKKAGQVPPAIDVTAANAHPPPSSFHFGNKTPGSSSAPAINQVFEFDTPTILYETPEPMHDPIAVPIVAPLKIRRTSTQTQAGFRGHVGKVQVTLPQSADALRTTFNVNFEDGPTAAGRAQRASICVSPSATSPAVPPLRFKSVKPGTRTRSSTVGDKPRVLPLGKSLTLDKENVPEAPIVDRKSSDTETSEDSESDHLSTPTAPNVPLPSVVEAHTTNEDTRGRENTAGISIYKSGSTFSMIQPANGTHISIDPAFADIIKSIAGASEEEQMGSLLTIASSINTEHHASSYNAGFLIPVVDESRTRMDDGFVDIDDDGNELRRKETVRKSMSSGISASERRRSKGRSISSMKKRYSMRTAAAVRAVIRALPDPSTFPIPDSGGSVATDSSALNGGADYTDFTIRPSPLPKLRVVTKFKNGGTVLLPATSAPLSATSTKSSMSNFGGGHSRNASAVSIAAAKRSSMSGRKMNRLTLTDPRSPMNEAAVAAATLVARVRQKRAKLAGRRKVAQAQAQLKQGFGNGGNGGESGCISDNGEEPTATIHVVTRAGGHSRSGSASSATQTLRSKLKMSGGSFFGGSNVRRRPGKGRFAPFTRANSNLNPNPVSNSNSGSSSVVDVQLSTSAFSSNVYSSSSNSSPTSVSASVSNDKESESDADADVIFRNGPLAHRPTIRRARTAHESVVPPAVIGGDIARVGLDLLA